MPLTRRKLWIAAVVVAVAAAGGWWWWRTRPVNIQAIQVSAFSGDAALSEALRGEVIDDLARIPGLAIVDAPAAPPAVTGVLRATVERSPERIRVVVELTRADGHFYWTRKVDRPIADLPNVAEDVATNVNGKARRKKVSKYRPALAAYDAYLEGRYHFDHPENDGLAKAIARLEDATRLDASFAEAWAWLSIAKE